LEKQLLPSAQLKPAYEQVVWMYVYRDFSNNESDVKAERVSLRLGVTSWPQLLLVDPVTVDVIGSTGRTAPSFLRAATAAAAKVKPKSPAGADRIRAADRRAAQLEKDPSTELARQFLEDEDVVVRYRALRVLAQKSPELVARRAAALLQTPNDSFRYEVCDVLAKSGGADARESLESLVKNPRNSKNPNVLRSRAVTALATCGGPESIDVLAPFTRGSPLNMLTRTTVATVAQIGTRHPESKPRVHRVLLDAFPQPVKSPAVQVRYTTALAQSVHDSLKQVTKKTAPFPRVYDAASRRQLIERWRQTEP
jgi:hypothetical protein